ncbi:P-loop containing nucleoside triphosphate hydrolase protein [Parachaetomium inaequale]|uniref:Gluconokinase n=1 Tax=Parachaetomium inaequale TaxID=2588326 RepID=A0AAN6SRQ5_9PEZI|nr:P-loop containing nucleoside triphosphate hydrolase protein [Parachaetomium inaequale]
MMSQQPQSESSIGDDKQTGPRWIWFVTGPTACGKTTIAKALAETLDFTFVEGDDYHPQANRDKMARNQPLTDADRAAWLTALREHEHEHERTADPSAPSPNLVVTCSALKRRYRDVLRPGSDQDHGHDAAGGDSLRVRFVFLDVDEDVLRQRARERKGHFAGEGLVSSQMEALERPGEDGEEGDVVVVRVGEGMGVGDTQGEVVRRVRGVMGI